MNITALKKAVLLFCFAVFCWHACFDLLQESKKTFSLFKALYGLTDNQKRAALFPDTWLIIDKLSKIIPQDARVLLHTDNFNEMFYCAYALFPRKFYLREDAEMHYLPSRSNLGLNWGWLKRKQISWIVVRTSDKLLRVLKIAEGAIVQEISFPG